MYGSECLSAGIIDKTPIAERTFVDITENYSDRLANVAAIRRGLPTIAERPPKIIQPEKPAGGSIVGHRPVSRANPFNKGIKQRLEPKANQGQGKGKPIQYETVFKICLALSRGETVRNVSRSVGINRGSVSNINLRKTVLAKRCWSEIEAGAKRPTTESDA